MTVDLSHRACAELLMAENGVDKKHLPVVIKEIERIWHHLTLHHSLIVLSVRGYLPNPHTKELERLLTVLKAVV